MRTKGLVTTVGVGIIAMLIALLISGSQTIAGLTFILALFSWSLRQRVKYAKLPPDDYLEKTGLPKYSIEASLAPVILFGAILVLYIVSQVYQFISLF